METNDRKAALLQEAATLKVPHDPNWSAEQLEKVIAKKRATLAAAAKPKDAEVEPAPVLEGADDVADDTDVRDEAIQLLAEENKTLKDEVAKLTEKLKASNAAMFDLEAEKSRVETELFDLRAKAGNVTEKPTVSEDFGGPKEAPAPKPKSTGATVMCKVTKSGAGNIFTGNGNDRYERGDVFEVPLETAATLETKGWVETD